MQAARPPGLTRRFRCRPWPSLAALAIATLGNLGCAGPLARAERASIEKSPLRDTRPGEVCRYRAVRRGLADETTAETWLLRVVSVEAGQARIAVSVLGPPRSPAGPSPREPGFEVSLPARDAGFSGLDVIRLLHRPELTEKGTRTVLARDVAGVTASVVTGQRVVRGQTRDVHEVHVVVEGDGPLVRAVYRLAIVDEIPVVGLLEADLEEVWTRLGPDGEPRTERRTDRLELVDQEGS